MEATMTKAAMHSPTVDEMRAMFRAHTEAALKVIVEIMTTGTGAKGETVRLAAAKEILSRGWGRPPSYKDMDPDKGAKPDARPVWRSPDGKTYAEVYAEKAAEVAAEEAAAAKRSAAPEPVPPPASALPPASAARDPDPTGYIARRALFSGPASAPPAAPAP
jgi:hypothetical protein